MKYSQKDHSFVICAYRESPYLEACIRSLTAQTVKSHILLSTSTPNPFIADLAEKYGIPVHINPEQTGIAGDWNFALSCAQTPLVTLAHQDDVYESDYTQEMLRCLNKSREPILFSGNYAELRGGEKVTSSRLLRIKRLMMLPIRLFPSGIAARRLTLAFGCPILCPSVTYVRDIVLKYPFLKGMYASLDWEEWERISKEKGSFVYSGKILVCHRIHEDSETSRVLRLHLRYDEDYRMFRKFWPEPIARILVKAYSSSEKSNELK